MELIDWKYLHCIHLTLNHLYFFIFLYEKCQKLWAKGPLLKDRWNLCTDSLRTSVSAEQLWLWSGTAYLLSCQIHWHATAEEFRHPEMLPFTYGEDWIKYIGEDTNHLFLAKFRMTAEWLGWNWLYLLGLCWNNFRKKRVLLIHRVSHDFKDNWFENCWEMRAWTDGEAKLTVLAPNLESIPLYSCINSLY